MSKRLKPSSASHRRRKANREEHLTKYAGSIYASETNRNGNDEKGVVKQKK